ncbi:opioid growth factor receptor isoform X2 [Rhinatrema bivittatum]|uniref:opioid growth factor receptor isoform X2 n=1 Tax=Rhinatrema bivittatum TaxID=194408 RepID=UPI00112A23BA|nr:opioid growth factor receptor isoform X2 [Rhinatrema bivittatum]
MAGDGVDWEYDSTWEDDDDDEKEIAASEPEQRPAAAVQERKTSYWATSQQGMKGPQRNWRVARALQHYRRGYPGLQDQESDVEAMPNVDFYRNEIRFMPNGIKIDELLDFWRQDYDVLEDKHTYIQWLFPLREEGMNWYAKPLTQREIQEFRKSDAIMARFLHAYELMLGFYGIALVAPETGEVARAENWKERFQNLNRHTHNNLRITRILKCLGEMGYERYQAPLVRFFLRESLEEGTLPNVKQSALDYFLFTVRNKEQRRELVHYAWTRFSPRERFVWGPLKKLRRFEARRQKAALEPGSSDEGAGEEGNHAERAGQERRSQTGPEMREGAPQDPAFSQESKCERGNGERDPQSPSDAKKAGAGEGTAKDCKKRKLEARKPKSGAEAPEKPDESAIDSLSSSLEEISMSQRCTETPVAAREAGAAGEVSESDLDATRKRRRVERAEAERGSQDDEPSPSEPEETSAEAGCAGEEPVKQEESSLGGEGRRTQTSSVGTGALPRSAPEEMLTVGEEAQVPSEPEGTSAEAGCAGEEPVKQEESSLGGEGRRSQTSSVGTGALPRSAPEEMLTVGEEAQVPSAGQVESTGERAGPEGAGCMESGKAEKPEDPGRDQPDGSAGEAAEENSPERSRACTATEQLDEASALDQRKEESPRAEANAMEEGNSRNSSGSPQILPPTPQHNPKGSPAEEGEPETSASTGRTSKRTKEKQD